VISSPSAASSLSSKSASFRSVRSIRPERAWRSVLLKPPNARARTPPDAGRGAPNVSQGGRGPRRTRRGIRALRKAMMSDCACLVGRRQAVVSTKRHQRRWASPKLAERAVAMGACRAPTINMSVLPIRRLLARDFSPISICSTPEVPSTSELERRAGEAEAAALAVKGRDQGRAARRHRPELAAWCWLPLTGFHGSYLRSSQGHRDDREYRATAPAWNATYDYTSAPHAFRSRFARQGRPHRGRSAPSRAPKPAQGRDLQRCRWYSTPRVSGSLVGHLVGPRSMARRSARKTSFLKRPSRRAVVCEEYPHHRRSVAGARIALAIVRRRGCQGQEARHHRRGAC